MEAKPKPVVLGMQVHAWDAKVKLKFPTFTPEENAKYAAFWEEWEVCFGAPVRECMRLGGLWVQKRRR